MAKVSLRIYNREIETMVDRGQLEEAIAHCRHILNAFPKNLETYRLLGKAYLEARRYGEATDIFERLLMAVPDDFVAHVGMSIVRDEQNELDAAIWHMQRAFEVQPSNAAIQGELQRLFGRRDGVEPPKIRLTRGALSHMYMQGELYPQAISEIKVVLEEDRERQDMQVLLARAYFHAGQKNEAAEMCSQLLRRYPYCFDANRVLVELLPETERGESTQVYRRRVNELDPYATFTTGSIFHSEEVADAAISLERLEWSGQPVDLGQDWRDSLGIRLAEETAAGDEEPDWLRADYAAGAFNAPMPTEEPASVSSSDNEIPDFLREAGWGKDTGTFKESPGSFETSGEAPEEAELAEGDLPDWIKAMAPSGAGLADATPQSEQEEDLTQDDVPDWLQGLGHVQDSSPSEQPLEEGDLPDWLAALKPGGETPQSEEGMAAGPAGEEELTDWISAMKSVDESSQEAQAQDEMMAEPTGDDELPGWTPPELAGEAPQEAQPVDEGIAEPASEEDLPDWIAALKPGDESLQESQPADELMAKPAGDEDLPDWLADMKPGGEASQEPQLEGEPMAEAPEEADLPEWLRSVQAEQEMPVEPLQEAEQEVAELSGDALSDWQIGDEETEGTVSFDATDTGALGTSADEQDDAIAWLEGLAAKHGAKPEELVTKPEERTETEPEWIQQARAFKEGEAAEAPPAQEEPSADLPEFIARMRVEPVEPPRAEAAPVDTGAHAPSAEEQDDAIAWLESLAAKHGAKPEELVTDPGARKETAPEWVQKAAEAGPPAGEAAPLEEPVESIPEWIEPVKDEAGSLSADLEDTQPQKPVSPAAADETGIWLRDLGEAEPAAETESPPVGKDEDVPDWLREIEAETPKAEAGPTPEMEAQGPAWLEELEAEPSEPEEGLPSEREEQEVPDWLSELSQTEAEPSLPEAGPSAEPEPQDVPDWLLGVESDATATERFPVFPTEEETPVEPSSEGEFQAVETQAESDEVALTDWLKSIEEPEEPGVPAGETVIGETASDDLPSWLAGLEEEPVKPETVAGADDDLPEWLRSIDEQGPVQTERTAPTDWQPAEITSPFQEEPAAPAGEPEAEIEEQPVHAAPPVPAPEPEPQPTEPEPAPYVEPATQRRPGVTGALSSAQDPALTQAQTELEQGNLSGALNSYEKLIRKGKLLEEIIHDLREALDRYPVDVSILQALGDAYMRSNRLQDALDSYTKAEELLR